MNVRDWVSDIRPGDRAEVVVSAAVRHIATMLPFAEGTGADGMVIIRRAVMDSGRLPAVDVTESWSTIADGAEGDVAARARAALRAGNKGLEEYVCQPFFVAEPWTATPGEVTERGRTIARVEGLIESWRGVA